MKRRGCWNARASTLLPLTFSLSIRSALSGWSAIGGDDPLPLSLLPAGWERLLDAGSGKPYYFCASEGKTRWLHPARETEEVLGGWREEARQKGRPFYYMKDQQPQWVHPGYELDLVLQLCGAEVWRGGGGWRGRE